MTEKLIKHSKFISFDQSIEISTLHQKPDRYRQLEMPHNAFCLIPRGGGFSFSAASFGEEVLVQDMSVFDRFLEFDPIRNTVKVEAGMRIGDLINWAMQRGLYFPVLPGYPGITVGGCVAVDAHGKNPIKDGTFSDWTLEINLFNHSHQNMRLSRTENVEVFNLTCGGFGMTGVIVSTVLQLTKLPSRTFDIQKIFVSNLRESIRIMTEKCAASDYMYSWHDGTLRGKSFGSGIIFRGTWHIGVSANSHKNNTKRQRFFLRLESKIRLPIWNNLTLSIANYFFYILNKLTPSEEIEVNKAIFPLANNSLYHRFYGNKGFAEIQILVGNNFIETYIQKLEALIDKYDPPLAMISIKMFRGQQKSLSMSGEGFLIALNFFRTQKLVKFLSLLDMLSIEFSAQPNLSKDSRISELIASQTLPNYNSFRDKLMTFDPSRRYRSHLSAKIGL